MRHYVFGDNAGFNKLRPSADDGENVFHVVTSLRVKSGKPWTSQRAAKAAAPVKVKADKYKYARGKLRQTCADASVLAIKKTVKAMALDIAAPVAPMCGTRV